MNQEEIARFNDSLSRCVACPGFFERFRDLFLGSSPEVAETFRQTDAEKQLRVLRASVFMLMMTSVGPGDGNTSHLKRLKPVLGREGFNVSPQLYDHWIDALVQAVREHDTRLTPETELVWRKAMARGLAFMKGLSAES